MCLVGLSLFSFKFSIQITENLLKSIPDVCKNADSFQKEINRRNAEMNTWVRLYENYVELYSRSRRVASCQWLLPRLKPSSAQTLPLIGQVERILDGQATSFDELFDEFSRLQAQLKERIQTGQDELARRSVEERESLNQKRQELLRLQQRDLVLEQMATLQAQLDQTEQELTSIRASNEAMRSLQSTGQHPSSSSSVPAQKSKAKKGRKHAR